MTAEEFTDRYVSLSDRLFRVAYHILESEDEAVDAVQDLYVKLWTVRDGLDDVRNPLAYCVVLLRNICIDAVRHGGTHQCVHLDEFVAFQNEYDPSEKEKLEFVVKAMERLPARHRTVLRMRAIEGLTYEEMAEATGMNYLTLRVLMSQARKRLKELI